MDLLKMLLEAQGGGLLKQVAEKSGMDQAKAGSAISALLPSLAKGMQGNIARPGGLENLLNAVQAGNHTRYVDNPAELANHAGIEDGKSILGHILGSKDRSREVAAQAAEKTGIDVNVLKSMLPMIATMMMGGISKQAKSSGLGQQPGIPSASGALDKMTGGGGFGAILGKMLESQVSQEAQPAPQARQKRGGGLLDLVGKFFK